MTKYFCYVSDSNIDQLISQIDEHTIDSITVDELVGTNTGTVKDVTMPWGRRRRLNLSERHKKSFNLWDEFSLPVP
jgi:hypothetical protein